MRVQRSANPVLFFSKREKEEIEAAIKEAEMKTSGEIRVHLERKAQPDIMAHAKREFERLGMARTEGRNGVLIFMGVKSKRFALLGDQGIHEKVPADFWDQIVWKMAEHFKKDEFEDGIVEAIRIVGEKLAVYFSYQRDDVNELPDEISYSL